MRASPLAWPALRAALTSALVLALLALTAGGVRILPWILDPEIPWRIARPFARSVAAIAIEASILVGWPVGWALATYALVERGEARVLATLGEAPVKTTLRLAPLALLLSVILGAVSAVGARDATEPGRVVGELLEQGRLACVAARAPTTFTVPFVGATWLCDPAAPPRLVGRPPGGLGSAFYTAASARISADLRHVELDEAWLHLGRARLHVKTISLRGLPPFAQASSLAPALRAILLALAAAGAGLLAVWLTLRRAYDFDGPRRLHAIAIGAAGPLATLGLLRLIERHEALAMLPTYLALPLASWLATLVVGGAVWSLPLGRVAASK